MDCESSIHDRLERMLLDARPEPIDLPLSFLKAITNDFSDDQHIGKGGFAVVYKGQLQNGTLVAVKKLSQGVEMDEDKFIKEVDCLMRVKHRNIVRFLGYCADTQGKCLKYEGKNVMAEERERLLCFEFLPNKSLDKYINDASQELEWRTRYRIIKGICEGLHYLHQEFILHLDLKPANILLNKDMVPKIADFGLSRCFDENKSQTITAQAAGTLGYMAPELLHDRRITFKSDIYSLGIIILEILTGQRYSAIGDVRSLYNHSKVLQSWSNMFDSSQEDIGLEHVIRVCAELGIECIDYDPAKRPTIRGIIDRLDEMERTHGYIETTTTSSAIHTHSIWPPEIDKLLDVHPLELRFPFEPNKRIQCPVSLTNKTNRYAGVWITPTSCADTRFDLCFPDSWDHDSEEDDESQEEDDDSDEWEEVEYLDEEEKSEVGESPEGGQSPKDPCSYFFQILEPHSTLVVAMTMKEQDEPPLPPQDMGKFEVVMIIMWSEQDLKDLESSIRNKMNMDNDLLKQVEELGGKVHPAAMLTAAVICDPASCQATMTKQIMSTGEFGEPLLVDVHPTNSWILAVHLDYVCIWNYQTQERVMELQVIKNDTCIISAIKFISRKQWFAAGDDRGYIHVYDYTTKDMVIKLRAHRGNDVSWLAVHATYPFLLSSSGGNQSSIRLWNWDEDWVCTRTFDGHTRGVQRIMFNPRNINSFASVSDDDTIKVWDIHSSDPETTLASLDAYSVDFVFTDSHRPLQLVTCDKQAGCACIWDVQTRKRVHRLAMRGMSMDLVASHPKLPLLVTTWKRTLCLWDANTYRLEKMVRLASSPIQGLEFLDTNLPRLLVGFENNDIAILETNLPATTTDTDESVIENYGGQHRIADTGFINPQCVDGVLLVFNSKYDVTPMKCAESTSETPISYPSIGDFNSSIMVNKEVQEVLRHTLSKAQLTENTIFNQIVTDTSCTDPFNGLYVGEYGSHGHEVVKLSRKFGKWNITDEESFEYVEAIKLTGDVNVPAGKTTFRAKIGKGNRLENHGTYPEEFGVIESYKGQGRIADTGFINPQWVDGELLVFNGKSKVGFVWNFPKPVFIILYFSLTHLICHSDETLSKCVDNFSENTSEGSPNP
ncbi:hypothetical protein SEVIR_8G037200v4 [Setaria viridis]|uniref:Protein kinase domain-containing protein n=1 Tax=Setaria viridis TaxID=4556 RepID=A0A4U6TBD7_SETVI|nr:probable serine/threonine-protein kinase PkwA isoform X1 [Setaria viridis]XP_034607113.1 probable serine/threonine-protein kinase PkwA isoform X1 [Setaria viridis]TKV99347.1 hypothetical protein SEVIR_8G037200v2 [Setaria viridis]TKV99348.1 hypothetical protein SEVIR_8G037200v2 [Setaria viridis]